MPVYNEEKILQKAVMGTVESLEQMDVKFEIIIVDDCSKDNSLAIAERILSENQNISLHRHDKNIGIGGAFRTGVSHSSGDYIMLIPIDNPITMEEFSTYFSRMPTCDIIVGVRIERVGYSRLMLMLSFVYNRILIPLLFNIGISDVNWIQAYRRNLFSTGVIEINCTGIFYLVELLIKAKRKRLIIAEVPSSMRRRFIGKPTSAKPMVIIKTLADMVRFFFWLNRDLNLR